MSANESPNSNRTASTISGQGAYRTIFAMIYGLLELDRPQVASTDGRAFMLGATAHNRGISLKTQYSRHWHEVELLKG